MSESSKMGLFGSKDETKELKNDTPSKEESPERYAPYCIDSDSETYDTEALSIMDINDIIGVQSEPIGDSTLESEIDALSQIITEPKASPTLEDELCQNEPNAKSAQRSNSDLNCETAQPVQDLISHKGSCDVSINKSNHFKEISNSTDVSNPVQLIDASEKPNTNVVKDILENKSVNESSNLNHDIEDDVRSYSPGSFSKISTDKSSTIKNNVPIVGVTSTVVQPYGTKSLVHIQNVNINKMDVRTNPEDESANDGSVSSVLESTNNVTNIGSISKSLQLIGEAYTSEDSQETNSNENEMESMLSAAVEDSVKTSITSDGILLEDELDQIDKATPMEVEKEPARIAETSAFSDIKTFESPQQDLTSNLNCSTTVTSTESNGTAVMCFLGSKSDSKCISLDKANEVNVAPENKEEISEPDEAAEKGLGETPVGDVNINTVEEGERTDTSTENRITEDRTAHQSETLDVASEIQSQEFRSSSNTSEKMKEQSTEQIPSTVTSPKVESGLSKEDRLEETTWPVQLTTGVENEFLDEGVQDNNVVQKRSTTKDSLNDVCEDIKVDCTLPSEDIGTDLRLELEKTEIPLDIDSSETEENVLQRPLPETRMEEIPTSILSNPNEFKNVQADSAFTKNKDSDYTSQSTEKEMEIHESSQEDDLETKSEITEIKPISRNEEPQTISSVSISEDIEETIREMSPIVTISDTPMEADDSQTENVPLVNSDKQDLSFPVSPNDERKRDLNIETTNNDVPVHTISDLNESNVNKEEKGVEPQTSIASLPESKETRETQLNEQSTDNVNNKTQQIGTHILDELPKTENMGQFEENTENTNAIGIISLQSVRTNEEEIENNISQGTVVEEGEKLAIIETEQMQQPVEMEEEEEIADDEMKLKFEEADFQLEIDTNLTLKDSEAIAVEKLNENMADLKKNASTDLNEKDHESSNAVQDSQPASPSRDVETCAINSNADKLEDKLFSNASNEDESMINCSNILKSTEDVAQLLSEENNENREDLVSSTLSGSDNTTHLKNILEIDSVANEVKKVLENSSELPNTEMKELSEKLTTDSEKMMDSQLEDQNTSQNIDTFEDILDLEVPREEETENKDVPEDFKPHVIDTCVERTSNDTLQETTNVEAVDDKIVETESHEPLKEDNNLDIPIKNVDDGIEQKETESDNELQENNMEMEYAGNPLESVDDLTEEGSTKLGLDDPLLLGSGAVENSSELPVEISQPNSEISELESAVKFLQESEEQAMDSPLVLSPKLVESVVQDISKQTNAGLFVSDEIICADTNELVEDLGDLPTDPISISEAEIISEAAKLESERKLAEQSKLEATSDEIQRNDLQKLEEFDNLPVKERIQNSNLPLEKETAAINKDLTIEESTSVLEITGKKDITNIETSSKMEHVLEEDKFQTEVITLPKLLERVQKIPESKVSILEERLKEPPKIEIPMAEITRMCDVPITPKNNLLIPKDAKLSAFQRMLDSPKASDKTETKNVDTPRKDAEKHDFDNVGSPRIILKIAKSAITDCGEPRSPKSPKIRSATNSPNPEDSPGQKLGKIKLKLSRGGHPSIISNENVEEASQWHTEGSALSPIGMKIKLSKSGDASIVTTDKHDNPDELKEGKLKYEEGKRTESPIGMKLKLSKSGDVSIVQQDCKESSTKHKEKLDGAQDSPKRTDSPIGMKIKLSKSGDASIIPPEKPEGYDDGSSKTRDRMDGNQKHPKRTDSPLGVKIKLSKSGDASIVPCESSDDLRESSENVKRTDSPVGMKLKISKAKGGSSAFIPVESDDMKDKLDVPEIPKRTESPLGMKIKLSKTGDASIIHTEVVDDSKKVDGLSEISRQLDSPSGTRIKSLQEIERTQEGGKEKVESGIGMKFKLSKTGDASIIPPDNENEEHKLKDPQVDTPKRIESPIGMKIKFSKTGDPSIVQNEEDFASRLRKTENEQQRVVESSLGMKIKLSKSGDASILEPEKREKTQKRRENDTSLEMKIKLSKTGHPTIIPPEGHSEITHKAKDSTESSYKEHKDAQMHKDSSLKMLKSSGHSGIVSSRSELTIEPVQFQGKKLENTLEISPKRKDVTISPIEIKKSKLEAQLSHILPEVTIQPVMSKDQKQLVFDPKTSLISRQQMNVISQEISITHVRPTKPTDISMSDKLKDILSKNTVGSPIGSDCEIIEHRPELIIVNENSNSSQDVMIIDEVPSMRMPDSAKTPKKRGRPRRNPVPPRMVHQSNQMMMPRDPLALDEVPQPAQFEQRENERPKRTCRSQKSYAPPKRGRGRGRGKRKLEAVDFPGGKRTRIEQDLSAIESSTMSVISLDASQGSQDISKNSSELYKALKQPPMDRKGMNALRPFDDPSMLAMLNESGMSMQLDPALMQNMSGGMCKTMPKLIITPTMLDSKRSGKSSVSEIILGKERKMDDKPTSNNTDKSSETGKNIISEGKCMLVPPGHSNWLTPTSKKQMETATRNDTVSTVQVIDEDTRMSAESGSRSQTPGRNIPVPASETIINEESQGSVLSTATTESEKVKVKNRRMEINFDPDEGPFTVDKIAEYEWPLDRKGETFMIQEQISQYLGVKSFKRKYPDLKRRMVDMEERNYLRENGLVSEAMCDMGLTAVCSSEVLDVMCSDFPDQYEEYRKHMREKQVKEHSKKQKELTAAANAEKNRIDLAEMAMQSAVSWNISLNKARRETRKCSLDLQTFTIHVPKKEQKVEDRRASHYPVALIPGQYTDYYREYTPAELRYYPLNTVLYGPMRPNMRKFDSQSEGSQSDSDSDSSSDDSSSTSSEGTQDTEESQSTMDDVDMELNNQKDEVKLKCKMCLKSTNKHGKTEILIQCGTCNGNVHPSCIDLTLDTVPHIQSYAWQCTDCKTCSQCHDPANEDKMLFCDMCDRGYHIYCVGLRRVPQGRWHCQECAVCANCGSREPGGVNSDRNSVAQWQHEYKKGDKNTRVYVSTLCVPCSKLWRKGRYCPHCSRCHTATRLDLEPNLVHCSACDKYLHLGCVETKGVPFDKKNYLCDFCSPNRQHTLKPLASKIFKT